MKYDVKNNHRVKRGVIFDVHSFSRPVVRFSLTSASFRALPRLPWASLVSSFDSPTGRPTDITFQVKPQNFTMEVNYNLIFSGFILVTLFATLNCCGLLVLLTMKPIKGTPMHDVTTGIISALSSLILLLISLGVISSRLCQAPPADNRVEVY